MKKLILIVAALFIVAGTQFVLQLAPDAVITIESWSPQELHDLGMEGHSTTGLDIVGVNSLVRLAGSEAAGEEVLTYLWTIATPGGGTIEPDVQGAMRMTFRPPTVGIFTVTLDITTASGASTTAVNLTAAEFVGVGNIAGATPSISGGQCAACHPGNTTDWAATGHSDMFTRYIDGGNDHYGEGCIECHTLGYDLSADNNGFDDVATDLGWAFPTATVPGNWQNIVDNFAELAQFANIQCENCHGPGSLHKGNAAGIAVDVRTGVCAVCHDEEPYHRRPAMWKNSAHATGTSFGRGTRAGCADCHSSYGFIAMVDPLSDLSQKVGTGEGVECAACHDPHDVTNPNQLRKISDVELADGTVVTWGGPGKLCMNCHQARRTAADVIASGSTRIDPHHSNQTDMVAGNTQVPVTFGRYIPSSTHRDALVDGCVSCHMAPTPAAGMVTRDKLGDHSFAVYAKIDGVDYDFVEACQACHGPIEHFTDIMAREDYDGDGTVENFRAELHGVEDQLAMLIPPLGSTEFPDAGAPENNDLTLMQKYGLFNLNFVHDDASDGVHNFQYAMGLLKVSIEALTFGVLAPGAITSVADVPGDQGNQVQVIWERFGGDGTAVDPLVMYYVWRKDAVVAKDVKTTTLDKVPLEPVDGLAITLDGHEVWTAVASQPAAQMDVYSAIAPTLYNVVPGSDAVTEFMVTGHTAGSSYAVMSAPMPGAAVDNLAPATPSGLVAAARPGRIVLTWSDPVDSDFSHFVVYRTNTAFEYGEIIEPYAEVTDGQFADFNIEYGKYYLYMIGAVDVNENHSEFSPQVEAAIGIGTEELGVPTEFALLPNYPNPFNPTTTISFDVPAASDISIAVYDLLGRQVASLVDGSTSAGRHTVTFDARDLTSGLYIVRMRTGDRTFERSIVLMK